MTPVGWGGVVTGNAAAAGNSLIVAPEMPGWMDGVGPFEDGFNVAESLSTGDWVGASLNMGSIALDVASAIMNPIATLVSLGAGWVLEHVFPLSDWLDQLTGDHHMVTSYAATWAGVAEAVHSAGADLEASIPDLQSLSGFTIDAYRAFLTTMASALNTASMMAKGVGIAVELLSTIVKAVHDLVRDALSDLVGYVVQALVEIAATLGAATPVVAAQVAIKAADWAALLAKFVKDLIRSAGTYVDLAKSLKDVYDGVSESLSSHMRTA